MDQGTSTQDITFARRPGEATQRVVLGAIVLGVLIYVLVKLLPIIPALFVYRGTNATLAQVVLLPVLVLFPLFAVYMTWEIGRSLRSAVADRNLPLLTINKSGVTLYGISRTTLVPWDELTAVRVEQFRSARFLKLDVRNPDLFRGGKAKNGITLGLQPLDGLADKVAETIRRYPDYRGQSR